MQFHQQRRCLCAVLSVSVHWCQSVCSEWNEEQSSSVQFLCFLNWGFIIVSSREKEREKMSAREIREEQSGDDGCQVCNTISLVVSKLGREDAIIGGLREKERLDGHISSKKLSRGLLTAGNL